MLKDDDKLVCLECKKAVINLRGNVVVKRKEQFETKTITGLKILCEDCLMDLATRDYKTEYGLLWELSIVNENYFNLFESIIEETGEYGMYTFSEKALLDYIRLGQYLYNKKTNEK